MAYHQDEGYGQVMVICTATRLQKTRNFVKMQGSLCSGPLSPTPQGRPSEAHSVLWVAKSACTRDHTP